MRGIYPAYFSVFTRFQKVRIDVGSFIIRYFEIPVIVISIFKSIGINFYMYFCLTDDLHEKLAFNFNSNFMVFLFNFALQTVRLLNDFTNDIEDRKSVV